MKKKIILKLIVVLVTIGIIYEGYGMIREFTTSSRILEEVNTKDLSSNDKSIAIVLQNEDDSWEEATDRSKWPSKEDYGYMGAECTDSEGASIPSENILKFDLNTYHATIDTKNSIYCTLYFAKGKPVLDVLKETGGSVFAGGGDHVTALDGIYRYVGTSTAVNNNYICFGTTDKGDCIKNADKYMYRIIGITAEERVENNGKDLIFHKNQLKLIKALPYGEEQQWNTSRILGGGWDYMPIKSYLNDTFYNNLMENDQNGSYWCSLITSQKWYIGSTHSSYLSDPTRIHSKISNDSKIGLLTVIEHYYATSNGSRWLRVDEGWNTSPDFVGNRYWEWTMTSYSCYADGGNCEAFAPSTTTIEYTDFINGKSWVRPVFYLQPQINLTGTGKSDDPFRIRSMNNVQ